MRPLFQLITAEIGRSKLIAINYFDESGRHADQLIGEIDGDEDLAIVDAVIGAMRAHNVDTVDVETDNDLVFKIFMTVPGIKVSLVAPSELSGLRQQLSPGSPIYPLLADVCEPEEPEEEEEQAEEQPEPRIPWYVRIIKYIRGVFIND